MKTEIGNVRIIMMIDPTVAIISIRPPRCPSAVVVCGERNKRDKREMFNYVIICQISLKCGMKASQLNVNRSETVTLFSVEIKSQMFLDKIEFGPAQRPAGRN